MKKDNKGFSLVELIVVVAIMAVLMVVVTPALLRYVEKTRLQRDNSAISEVANAAKIACASETINKEVAQAGGVTITIPIATGDVTCAPVTSGKTITNFDNEMKAAMGKITLTSNTYTTVATGSEPVVAVSINSDMVVTVTGYNLTIDGTKYTTGTPYTY